MRAVLWEGKPEKVVVKNVPVPTIQRPEDVIVRVTVATICGSDLHIWHGELGGSEVPWIMGHEAVGIVTEIGTAVDTIKIGDKVVIPDAPAAGHIVVDAVRTPLGELGSGSYGLGNGFGLDLGGCQAEYVRVPFADDSLTKIPNDPAINELDYLLLSDIWPTAWECLDFSGFRPGDAVAVFGAGPVGLLCAYSALLRGASAVFSIDHVPLRLELAKTLGAIPIDFTKGDPSAQILAKRKEGVNRCCDCCGSVTSLNGNLERDPDYIMREAVKLASFRGGIGFVGVYFHCPPSQGTPRGDDVPANISFPISDFMSKNLSLSGGFADVKRLWRQLLDLLEGGRAHPSFIVSDEVGIDEVPEAYERFDKKRETKTIIRFPWQDESS
ncbi:GroES-like protein [Lentithecium fluviatile CBS 122367]|uniref:GroES-like protein n=1 Tax=Lentithecium fluviatile CBS 122367 TaxID=1168545 RepID=A0A6G1IN44_9PLEO|nr:GroES-like protein [Lentithecium fluviatile CBS 122367]